MIKLVKTNADILNSSYKKEHNFIKAGKFLLCRKKSVFSAIFFFLSLYFACLYVMEPQENSRFFESNFYSFIKLFSIWGFLTIWFTKDKRTEWSERNWKRSYLNAKRGNFSIFKNLDIVKTVDYAYPTNENVFTAFKNNVGVISITTILVMVISGVFNKEPLAHLYVYLVITLVVGILYFAVLSQLFLSRAQRKKNYEDWLRSCVEHEKGD